MIAALIAFVILFVGAIMLAAALLWRVREDERRLREWRSITYATNTTRPVCLSCGRVVLAVWGDGRCATCTREPTSIRELVDR